MATEGSLYSSIYLDLETWQALSSNPSPFLRLAFSVSLGNVWKFIIGGCCLEWLKLPLGAVSNPTAWGNKLKLGYIQGSRGWKWPLAMLLVGWIRTQMVTGCLQGWWSKSKFLATRFCHPSRFKWSFSTFCPHMWSMVAAKCMHFQIQKSITSSRLVWSESCL